MYYNAGWQLVEEDIYEGWTSGNPGSVDEVRAYLWGARYIDDSIAMLIDGDADGDYDPTDVNDDVYFFLTDAQFSVIAVLDDSADLEERVTYDAYGTARHHDWRDVDRDGDYDATDYSTITTLAGVPGGTPITSASYEVDADVDRDGDVDSSDQTLAGTNYPTALPKGELSYPAIGNIIGYDGYMFNAETEQYKVRNRDYDTVLGRWLERDPLDGADSKNLYEYVRSEPIVRIDASGLADWWWITETPSALGRGPMKIDLKVTHKWLDRIYLPENQRWELATGQWVWRKSDYLIHVRTNWKINFNVGARMGKGNPFLEDETGTVFTARFSTYSYQAPTARLLGPIVEKNKNWAPALTRILCRKLVYLSQKCCFNRFNWITGESSRVTRKAYRGVYLFGATQVDGFGQLYCNTSTAERQLANLVLDNNNQKVSICSDSFDVGGSPWLSLHGAGLENSASGLTYRPGHNIGVPITPGLYRVAPTPDD